MKNIYQEKYANYGKNHIWNSPILLVFSTCNHLKENLYLLGNISQSLQYAIWKNKIRLTNFLPKLLFLIGMIRKKRNLENWNNKSELNYNQVFKHSNM